MRGEFSSQRTARGGAIQELLRPQSEMIDMLVSESMGSVAAFARVHPSDTELERHYLGLIPEGSELVVVEEHLLVCGECIQRAEGTASYVDAIRAAAILGGFDQDY